MDMKSLSNDGITVSQNRHYYMTGPQKIRKFSHSMQRKTNLLSRILNIHAFLRELGQKLLIMLTGRLLCIRTDVICKCKQLFGIQRNLMEQEGRGPLGNQSVAKSRGKKIR